MKKVLLVNPWIYDFTAFDFWLKPLGLLYVAGVLQKYGYNIELIDCMYRHDPDLKDFLLKKDFKGLKDREYGVGHFYYEIVEKPKVFSDIPRHYKRYGLPVDVFVEKLDRISRPDIIGVTSGMTYWYEGVFKAIEILKEKFKGVPVVLGGIYATLCYDHAVKNSKADYVVKGQGELAMLKFADEICNVRRDYSEFPNSIDELPYPAYNLYPFLSSVSVVGSLGCPLRCTYCASFMLQPKFKYRDADLFIKELELYVRRGIYDIAFYDDALLWKQHRFIQQLFSRLVERKLPIRFHTPNGIHAKEVDIDLAQKLYDANFKTLNVALETVNVNHQKMISAGKITNDEFERCIKSLKQVGFTHKNISAYVMIGLPDQKVEDIIKTFEFVYNLGVKIYVSQFSPVPGTPEFKKVVMSYGFDFTEPLNSNKTAFPLRNKVMSYKRYEKIRSFAKFLNRNVGKNLDVKLEAEKFGVYYD